jgi:hypothetical protein
MEAMLFAGLEFSQFSQSPLEVKVFGGMKRGNREEAKVGNISSAAGSSDSYQGG